MSVLTVQVKPRGSAFNAVLGGFEKTVKAIKQCFLVLMLITVILMVKFVSEFLKCDLKLLSSTFLWCCFLCCTRWSYVVRLWIKS